MNHWTQLTLTRRATPPIPLVGLYKPPPSRSIVSGDDGRIGQQSGRVATPKPRRQVYRRVALR